MYIHELTFFISQTLKTIFFTVDIKISYDLFRILGIVFLGIGEGIRAHI